MAGVGGYAVSLSLGGRPFSPVADAEVNIQLGGDNNDVSPNGDDTGRLLKSKMPWSADGVVVENDHDKEDHEFIQSLADRKTFFAVVIGLSDGTLYQGDGQITGEMTASAQSASIPIALKGVGKMTQQ